MHIDQAVARRASVRAFLPTPVPEQTLRELLAEAAQAPSGGNLQPWRVHVLVGEPLAALRRQVVAAIEGATADTRVRGLSRGLVGALSPAPLRGRRRAFRGSGRGRQGPGRATRDALLRNAGFFGAPVGLFFCLDRRFGAPQWSDLGMYMQTLMLLAVGRGLDACPQQVWSNWPETLQRCLGLADGQMVFAGMSLGWRDPQHPLNAFQTGRAPLDSFTTWHGFAASSPTDP